MSNTDSNSLWTLDLKMLWLFFTLSLLIVPPITAEAKCKRFETLEVVLRSKMAETLPWTTQEAVTGGWNKIVTVEEYSLDMYRFKEVNNLFIFFYRNNLAGVGPTFKYEETANKETSLRETKDDEKHMAHIVAPGTTFKQKIKELLSNNNVYMFRHTVEIDLIPYNFALILFIDPSILKEKSDDPCSKNMIFFEGATLGNWNQISISEKDISTENENNSEMYKQGCLDGFGYYYFYRLRGSTTCYHLHGFFSFYDDKETLSGFGAFYFGNDELIYVKNNHPHPVYSFLNLFDVKMMVPTNENCITKNAREGLTAIHFFIKPKSEPGDSFFVCKNGE